MNPIIMMKLKAELDAIAKRHPKFAAFVQYLIDHEIPAGTVLEVTVKLPDGGTVRSNLKLTEEDAQLVRQLKQAKNN